MKGVAKLASRQARSVARLAAVQALYQMETAGAGVEAVVREFREHRFGRDLEGQTLADADEDFFADIVRGVVGRQAEIDRLVTARLAGGWKLSRLDATTRALLRAGTWELLATDTPTEIVLDECVELAKAFHEAASESGFVNGALDAVAREVRG